MSEPRSKVTREEMGWGDGKFAAANRAARNFRKGHDEPVDHEWLEHMSREEAEKYLELCDGWQQSYEYAMESGELYHPTAKHGDPLHTWEVTPKFQEMMRRAIKLNESITRRCKRHLAKIGGSSE